MSGGLKLIALSRFASSVAMMTYAGSLPFLMPEWELSGTQAGSIHSVLSVTYAVSLLVSSWLADHIGAKQIFLWSNWASAAAFMACAVMVRSYESALLFFGLLGMALGGSYTPALMLVAEDAPPERRGRAIGLVLAASSFGYFAAISIAAGATPWLGYERTWLILAPLPLLGALAATAGIRGRANRIHKREMLGATPSFFSTMMSRRSLLLTAGYTAHCWELLGMWAWAPAFLTMALTSESGLTPIAVGVVVASVLHLSGAASTLVGGAMSDRFGRRSVLITMALSGAALSFIFGWSAQLGATSLVIIACAYGFATLGDSGVLSTAMTESVPARHLGSMLALRSILGFGAGALSPLTFGWVLDLTNSGPGAPENWGWAFCLFGLGGALASACALLLPKEIPADR